MSAAAADAPDSATAMRIVPGLEEPLIPAGPAVTGEDAALSQAIAAFDGRRREDDVGAFTAFLQRYPASRWTVALQTDLGLLYYHYGYFSKALDAWDHAWRDGRSSGDPRITPIVDRAVGELARMHARLGHAEALRILMAELGDRPVIGSATEAVTGAREGLEIMRTDPGIAYLCGPMALKNLLIAEHHDPKQFAFLDDVRSGEHGVTLDQVSHYATRADLPHRLIRRAPGEAVPVPSIIHWKVSHFAAIVSQDGERFHVVDPTFGKDLWITQGAIDAESDGYFLVPQSAAPAQWREASLAEVSQVRGMGYPGGVEDTDTGGQCCHSQSTDPVGAQTDGMASGAGMPSYMFGEMLVNLQIKDMPVGYQPSKGPSAKVTLYYNQREAYQPATFSYFNIGRKWTLSVLAYITDDPRSAGSSVSRYGPNGGTVYYGGYNGSTGAFTPEPRDAAVLSRTVTGNIAYTRTLADGSTETYAASSGATSYPRQIFLTRLTDPAGNALTFTYDAQRRLTGMTDATGRTTTLSYDLPASPLLVTRITDPFGRQARLSYDAGGRLQAITDVLGLTSQFSYDASSLINAMTTPYGTTRFTYGQDGTYRYLTATDPLGDTERLEWYQPAPSGVLPFSVPDQDIPAGLINPFNAYIDGRDTFYWDKHANAVAPGDYTKSRVRHWMHLNTNGNLMYHALESYKYPLENRVWMSYPDQSNTGFSGSLDMPIQIGRVLDDGTTQMRTFSYNARGKPLTAIDAVGRKTVFTYAGNGIDLIKIEQQTSTGGALSKIAGFTYNGQHLPLTYTDAAGQTVQYGYNAAGQRTTTTNALNQTTTYGYDGYGRMTVVTNANGVTQQSMTYDAFDRVATATDSEGYTLSYSYDSFDRVTQILYPDGTTTAYAYDRLDQASVKDRLGRVTQYKHDAARRLTATIDPLNQTTGYGYYQNGVLASLTDPKGNVTTWDIDIQSRPTAKHYANGNLETYTYEATTSRQKTLTDSRGEVKTFGYTRDDRVAALTYTKTANPTPNVKFSYDAFFPRLASMVDGIGTTKWQYQPVGALGALKPALEDGPYTNDTVAYAYDALGRVATRTVDTAPESFGYDAIGRTIAHNSALGNFTRSYLGQTSQLTGQTTGIVGTTWSHDTNARDRRLTAITNSGQARSFGFTTTPENRITGITESVAGVTQRSWSYGYDDLDRLTGAQPSSGASYGYGYDPADNLSNINGTGATYNAANQIATFGGTPYVYDANGNVLDDGTRTYRWDAESRLIGIGYKAQPSNTTALRYDGMGRRLGITDVSGVATNDARTLWCGDTLCQARSSSDQVTRRYFDEGVVTPQSSQLLYYGLDQLGSVRDLLVVQNGSKVASFDYEPYGRPATVSGRVNSEFLYADLYFHGQSGLYLSNYRPYDARVGRWLSRDPIRESGGENVYSYSNSSPIGQRDELGLRPPEYLPPALPNGTSRAKQNVDTAEGILWPPTFRSLVQNGGDWDYKQYDPRYQNFGNYNYGLTGAATGMFTLETLLQQAGRAQCAAGTSTPQWGNPRLGPPYGDDPGDQKWIIEGWNDYFAGMYGTPLGLRGEAVLTSWYSNSLQRSVVCPCDGK